MPPLANKLKQAGVKDQKKRTEPLWKGPESTAQNGGITFSLLSRFLCCRERFRLLVIEGLKPTDTFNHKIEYGNMWHVCEEFYAASGFDGQWDEQLVAYARKLCKKYPLQQEQIDHWYRVCKVQFPVYVGYWSKHPDVTERTPLLQEQVFAVPYKLPSGRIVTLKGKRDSVDLIGKGKTAGIYLQENKSKGDIKEQQLQRQLSFDLQTMLYFVALLEESKKDDWPTQEKPYYKVPILGVRYNVIRRPLSGGAGTIRQHKPSKSNPAGEGKDEFYQRLLNDYIAAEPQTFFMRWKIDITPADVTRFKKECLDPILESLCDWYEWITAGGVADPFWGDTVSGPYERHSHHWRMPYGVYNVTLEGGSSDVDEYLATGSEVGLHRTENLFPELTNV